MTAHVILELARAGGRIDRHRNRSGHLHAEECRQIVDSGRQHQRRGLTGFESAIDESRRDALRAFHQGRERDLHGLSVRSAELYMNSVPMVLRVEVHRLQQRDSPGGERVHGVHSCFTTSHRHGSPGTPVAGQQGRQQLPRSLGVRHDRFGNRRTEPALESREQFHPRKAVEPEITIERAVEGDLGARVEMGVKLMYDLAHRREQRGRIENLRLGRFFLGAIGHGARDRGGGTLPGASGGTGRA